MGVVAGLVGSRFTIVGVAAGGRAVLGGSSPSGSPSAVGLFFGLYPPTGPRRCGPSTPFATSEDAMSLLPPSRHAVTGEPYDESRDGPPTWADEPIDGLAEPDDVDEDFAPRAKQRPGIVTALLSVALVGGGGFLGGVLVQKHHDTNASTGSSSLSGLNFGAGRGAGAGGRFAGLGGTPGQSLGGAQATPAVIGQVMRVGKDTVLVKNFGGKEVTVHLSSSTTVTTKANAPGLAAGKTVSVAGKARADGSVDATAIVVQ